MDIALVFEGDVCIFSSDKGKCQSNCAPSSVGYPCDLLSPLPYHSTKQLSLFLCLFHGSNFSSDQKIIHHLCLIMDNLVYRTFMIIIN